LKPKLEDEDPSTLVAFFSHDRTFVNSGRNLLISKFRKSQLKILIYQADNQEGDWIILGGSKSILELFFKKDPKLTFQDILLQNHQKSGYGHQETDIFGDYESSEYGMSVRSGKNRYLLNIMHGKVNCIAGKTDSGPSVSNI
jgi:hypothetical protein